MAVVTPRAFSNKLRPPPAHTESAPPPVIARSVPPLQNRFFSVDVVKFASNLRQTHPQTCSDLRLNAGVNELFDPYDIHVRGKDFLTAVLLFIVNENIISFSVLWSERNRERVHKLCEPVTDLRLYFTAEEFKNYGAPFLEEALSYMRICLERLGKEQRAERRRLLEAEVLLQRSSASAEDSRNDNTSTQHVGVNPLASQAHSRREKSTTSEDILPNGTHLPTSVSAPDTLFLPSAHPDPALPRSSSDHGLRRRASAGEAPPKNRLSQRRQPSSRVLQEHVGNRVFSNGTPHMVPATPVMHQQIAYMSAQHGPIVMQADPRQYPVNAAIRPRNGLEDITNLQGDLIAQQQLAVGPATLQTLPHGMYVVEQGPPFPSHNGFVRGPNWNRNARSNFTNHEGKPRKMSVGSQSVRGGFQAGAKQHNNVGFRQQDQNNVRQYGRRASVQSRITSASHDAVEEFPVFMDQQREVSAQQFSHDGYSGDHIVDEHYIGADVEDIFQLWVTNIADGVTPKHLLGRFQEVVAANDCSPIMYDTHGKSYAFITFHKTADARLALNKLNGAPLRGLNLVVKVPSRDLWSHKPSYSQPQYASTYYPYNLKGEYELGLHGRRNNPFPTVSRGGSARIDWGGYRRRSSASRPYKPLEDSAEPLGHFSPQDARNGVQNQLQSPGDSPELLRRKSRDVKTQNGSPTKSGSSTPKRKSKSGRYTNNQPHDEKAPEVAVSAVEGSPRPRNRSGLDGRRASIIHTIVENPAEGVATDDVASPTTFVGVEEPPINGPSTESVQAPHDPHGDPRKDSQVPPDLLQEIDRDFEEEKVSVLQGKVPEEPSKRASAATSVDVEFVTEPLSTNEGEGDRPEDIKVTRPDTATDAEQPDNVAQPSSDLPSVAQSGAQSGAQLGAQHKALPVAHSEMAQSKMTPLTTSEARDNLKAPDAPTPPEPLAPIEPAAPAQPIESKPVDNEKANDTVLETRAEPPAKPIVKETGSIHPFARKKEPKKKKEKKPKRGEKNPSSSKKTPPSKAKAVEMGSETAVPLSPTTPKHLVTSGKEEASSPADFQDARSSLNTPVDAEMPAAAQSLKLEEAPANENELEASSNIEDKPIALAETPANDPPTIFTTTNPSPTKELPQALQLTATPAPPTPYRPKIVNTSDADSDASADAFELKPSHLTPSTPSRLREAATPPRTPTMRTPTMPSFTGSAKRSNANTPTRARVDREQDGPFRGAVEALVEAAGLLGEGNGMEPKHGALFSLKDVVEKVREAREDVQKARDDDDDDDDDGATATGLGLGLDLAGGDGEVVGGDGGEVKAAAKKKNKKKKKKAGEKMGEVQVVASGG